MSKSFTDKEKENIKADLMSVAADCLKQYGIKKTTVDEIVNRCHISKGSFYSFYDSKELLFWDVFLKFHDDIHNTLFSKLKNAGKITSECLTEIIYDCFKMCYDTGLEKFLLSGEIELLYRKLPPEILAEHLDADNDLAEKISKYITFKDTKNAVLFSDSFRAIFLILQFPKEIGENFDEVLKLLINGVVIQFMEEK